MPREPSDPTGDDDIPPEERAPQDDAPASEGLAPEARRGLPGLGMPDDDGSGQDDRADEGAEPGPWVTADDAIDAPGDRPVSPDPAPDAPRTTADEGLIADEARDEPLLVSTGEADGQDGSQHDHPDEESGGSFATRALWALVLLLFGIGLGLWAAPRIAPMLPAGLAPVATWLNPAARDEDTRIAALEARLGETDTRIGEMAAQANVDPRVEALVSAAGAKLEAEIADLRSQIGAAGAAAGADVGAQIDQVGSRLQAQSEALDALKSQVSGAAAEPVSDAVRSQIDALRGGLDRVQSELRTLSDKTATLSDTASQLSADFDGLPAKVSALADRLGALPEGLDGLPAQVASLSDRLDALASRIDEVAADAEAKIAAAETRAAESAKQASAARQSADQQTALAQVRAAVASGAPFGDALYRLGTVPMGLSAVAASGAVPLAELRDRFPEAAHAALRAASAATDGGLAARSRAFLGAQFASRSLSPQAGDGADAILSRMEDDLRRGDLAAALSEAEKLPAEAHDAMQGWLADARGRVRAEAALAALTADLSATN